MIRLQDLGFTDEETKIMDSAFGLFGEKIANYIIEEMEKEGPCVLCKNDDPGRCPFCPASPKKEVLE